MGLEPVFVFGVFELDISERELRKHGLKIKLQDQPLQILILLLEHAGKVVTREQIQTKLWEPGTHVDYENAINSAIRKLRDVLGDTADNPRFIETLARRGYRFVAPVSRNGGTIEIPAPRVLPSTDPKPVAKATSNARTWWMLAAALVLTVGLGVSVWLVRRADQGNQLTLAVPLTGSPDAECCPSFSPDGSRVAFSRYEPRVNPDVFVKLIGLGEPLRLTQNPAADIFPAWSPDGRWIAFLRVRFWDRWDPSVDDRRAILLLIPSLGGPERELATLDLTARHYLEGHAIAWSADSKYLYTIENIGPSAAVGIVRIAEDSGEKRQVTEPPPGASGDGAPSISPDGRTLAFIRTVARLSNGDIYLLPLADSSAASTGKPERITFDARFISGPAWSADGQDLIFSSDRGGLVELWRVAAFGSRTPVRLLGAGQSFVIPGGRQYLDVSRQGQRLVYTQLTAAGPVLWRADTMGDRADKPVRLASSTPGDLFPQYSPDGEKVAYQSPRSGRMEVWIANADGSNPVQLSFSAAGWSGTPRWSPDGRSIAFDSNRAGTWDIYIVNSQGGKAIPLVSHPATEAVPSWSRDGKIVYFLSTRSGRSEVWKIPASGGPEVQVTKRGGFMAFESADGKDLYFTKSDGIGPLWRMPVEGGEEAQVLPSVGGRDFAVAARRVYFIEHTERGGLLRFLELGSRRTRTLTLTELGNGWFPSLTVSPDERSIIYSQDPDKLVRTQYGSRLMLVENFR